MLLCDVMTPPEPAADENDVITGDVVSLSVTRHTRLSILLIEKDVQFMYLQQQLSFCFTATIQVNLCRMIYLGTRSELVFE